MLKGELVYKRIDVSAALTAKKWNNFEKELASRR
jgi:hypothetical protein